jgi:hypothetical protein
VSFLAFCSSRQLYAKLTALLFILVKIYGIDSVGHLKTENSLSSQFVAFSPSGSIILFQTALAPETILSLGKTRMIELFHFTFRVSALTQMEAIW